MPNKQRAHGEGSIFFHAGRGLWAASVSLGTDALGKRRRLTIYGKTKAEVKRKLDDERARHGGAFIARSPQTVAGYLEGWLRDDVKPNRSASTHATYGHVLKHAIPIIGNQKLDRFDSATIGAFYRKLRANGITSSIIAKIHVVLHTAFQAALRRRLILSNPFSLVERPVHKHATMKTLDAAQARQFLKAAAADPLEALFVLAITAGLRQGELFGLRWADVDLDAKRLSVRRSIEEIDGKRVVVDPKTPRSRRNVALTELAVLALGRRRVLAYAEGHRSPYCFTQLDGGLLRKSNVRRRSFKPLLERAKLPDVRFHDLRHTAASLLLLQGVNPKVVSEGLGHASVSLTLDTYSHVLPGLQQGAASLIDDLIGIDSVQPSRKKPK